MPVRRKLREKTRRVQRQAPASMSCQPSSRAASIQDGDFTPKQTESALIAVGAGRVGVPLGSGGSEIADVPSGPVEYPAEAGFGKNPVVGGVRVGLGGANEIGDGFLDNRRATHGDLRDAGAQHAVASLARVSRRVKGFLRW